MREPNEILQDSAETYREKDADYGNSWESAGDIISVITGGEPITLESPEDFASFGLFVRRIDKLARSFNGEFLADEMNFESITDSHEDETTYAAMHASLLAGRGQMNFVNTTGPRELEEFETTIEVGPTEAEDDVEPEYEDAYQNLRATGGD